MLEIVFVLAMLTIIYLLFQHLNTNPEVNDKVLITGHGGGKWYNHQLHGNQGC